MAKCNLLTQEILLRGLGVMKTTMKLMGRPDLRQEGEEYECPELAPGCCLRHGHRPWYQLRSEHHCEARKAGAQPSLRPLRAESLHQPWRSLRKATRPCSPAQSPTPRLGVGLATREALPGLPSQFSSGLTRHTYTSDWEPLPGETDSRRPAPSAQCGCSAMCAQWTCERMSLQWAWAARGHCCHTTVLSSQSSGSLRVLWGLFSMVGGAVQGGRRCQCH